MTTSRATPPSRIQRLRIWLWKMRYGWYVYWHTTEHTDWDGGYLRWCITQCAQAGWEVALDEVSGDVDAALALKPGEEAQNEIECWTDG